jgi:integrase
MPTALHEQVLPDTMRAAIQKVLVANNKRCHRTFFSTRTGRRFESKSVSKRTQESRAAMILLSYAELWKLGYRLQDPSHLRERHIEALVTHWLAKEQSPAYIQTRCSALRVFAGWIGKAGLVKPTLVLCPNGEVARERAAKFSKSWSDNGVQSAELIAKARALDQRFGIQLRLIDEFGLRVKEAIEMHPARVVTHDRKQIIVWEGTKGGRQRVIPIVRQSQRDAIEEALAFTGHSPDGRMRWPDRSWRQAQNHFYKLARKIGLTRADLGVTAHGLRHEFAQDAYQDITGRKTPVQGGDPKAIDPGLHRAASLEVSQLLGHSRISVTTSYYGTYGHQLRMPIRYSFRIDLPPTAAALEGGV